jgi:hypothetical protein
MGECRDVKSSVSANPPYRAVSGTGTTSAGDLYLPFCVPFPTFFLGEEDADGNHADAERERHYGVARPMTAKPLRILLGHPPRPAPMFEPFMNCLSDAHRECNTKKPYPDWYTCKSEIQVFPWRRSTLALNSSVSLAMFAAIRRAAPGADGP